MARVERVDDDHLRSWPAVCSPASPGENSASVDEGCRLAEDLQVAGAGEPRLIERQRQVIRAAKKRRFPGDAGVLTGARMGTGSSRASTSGRDRAPGLGWANCLLQSGKPEIDPGLRWSSRPTILWGGFNLPPAHRAALGVGEDRIVAFLALHHGSALHFESEKRLCSGEKKQVLSVGIRIIFLPHLCPVESIRLMKILPARLKKVPGCHSGKGRGYSGP
jgi:hypothetical protein